MASAPTPPFTIDAMRDELRTILLFTADFLAMACGPAVATGVTGFASEQFHRESPERVDLARLAIGPVMDIVYDYAFQVGQADRFGADCLQDATVFMLGAPRAGGQGVEGGETHPYMEPDGLCQRAVDTARARWKLDDEGLEDELSVRELALLANMSEGAVRNALAAAGVKAKGSRTLVDVAFAKEWLADRRGFVPTTCWSYGPDRAQLDIRTAGSVEALCGALARRAEQKGLAPQSLAQSAGISEARASAWLAGRPDLDVATATALATALDLDPALVAGRTVELVLRANA
jgi:hypothetical protein